MTLASQCPEEVRELVRDLNRRVVDAFLVQPPTGEVARKQHDALCEVTKRIKDAGF